LGNDDVDEMAIVAAQVATCVALDRDDEQPTGLV